MLQGSQEPLAAAVAAGRRTFSADTDGTIQRGPDGHILPHGGGRLVNLMAGSAAAEEARSRCAHAVELTERQACDVELLTVGGFTPLDGFMNEDAYHSVVQKMRWVLSHDRGGWCQHEGRLLAMPLPATHSPSFSHPEQPIAQVAQRPVVRPARGHGHQQRRHQAGRQAHADVQGAGGSAAAAACRRRCAHAAMAALAGDSPICSGPDCWVVLF